MKIENITNPDYPAVFSPLTIRGVTLPNRIAFPPWALKYADEKGYVTEKLTKFYHDLAKGGCGLIYTGAAIVSEDSVAQGLEKIMRIDDDSYIPPLKEMFDKIKEEGAVPALQIVHGGLQVLTPGQGMDAILCPSDTPIASLQEMSPETYKLRAMTIEEIEACIENFITAGLRGLKAGARAIDVHAGHCYLLAQFLSPRTNKRNDEYGGSIENRARIITRIIKGLRERGGDDFIISVRLSTDECLEGGIKPEDYKEICPLLEDAGADLLNMSMGTAVEAGHMQIPAIDMGEAPYSDIIGGIKEYTELPIVTVASIYSLKTAQSILAAGKADIVAMGRAQMADPDIVRKSAEGKDDSIHKCLVDNACINSFFQEPEIICVVNPDYKKKK